MPFAADSFAAEKNNAMSKKLITTLNNSRQYTMAVAAAMPANAYSFQPAADVMNFGELLNHIAYGIEWWVANFIQGEKTKWEPPAAATSPKEVKAYLQRAYNTFEKSISKPALSEDAVSGFYATLDHITHHRGQATTYLRCKGINPPEYMY